MKRRLFGLAGLLLAGLVMLVAARQDRAQGQGPPLPADYGPGPGGAVLGPGSQSTLPQPNRNANAAPDWWSTPYAGQPTANDARAMPSGLGPPPDGPDPNQDIAITPTQGLWLICVNSYSGPEAAKMARDMVVELRHNYQVPAFVFSHGREARRKEYERVRTIIQKQKEFFEQNNLPLAMPIRVKYQRIEEQYAVLVGGYPDQDSARRALEQVRKLKPPDPSRVKLASMFYVREDPKTGKTVGGEQVWVNPFARAFVVTNPTVKQDKSADPNPMDLEALRRLNAQEPYSLLKCPKPVTLAIAMMQTPTVVQTHASSQGFLEALSLGGKGGDKVDGAAVSAHNLAELLRKGKLEAYVLHTRFHSVVAVGAFDSLEDPALKSMQQLLATRLKLDPIQLFPQPLPMKVPR